MKVSIIVPVYNVEKYLPRCLNSLVHQTLDDIEIWVVNDGSTDSSPDIIHSFSEQYDNIHVLNKTRNAVDIDGVRQVTRQAHDDGDIGMVALPGEGE